MQKTVVLQTGCSPCHTPCKTTVFYLLVQDPRTLPQICDPYGIGRIVAPSVPGIKRINARLVDAEGGNVTVTDRKGLAVLPSPEPFRIPFSRRLIKNVQIPINIHDPHLQIQSGQGPFRPGLQVGSCAVFRPVPACFKGFPGKRPQVIP